MFLFFGAVSLGSRCNHEVGCITEGCSDTPVGAKLVTGGCSSRQAIILTREAIGHFQESEPFSHVDPEESEETRFLNLLGTIFKGISFPSSVSKQNISISIDGLFTLCQTLAWECQEALCHSSPEEIWQCPGMDTAHGPKIDSHMA